jgi:hypothetical protein
VADRPELRHDFERVDASAFPSFMAHTDLARLWPVVYAEFPEFQLALRDRRSDAHLAHANGVPIVWDGSYDHLPRTAAEMVEMALRHKRRGLRFNAVGALQAVVHPQHQGSGLSAVVLQALATRTAALGLPALFAPIRPTHKPRYPWVPLARYVEWARSDGQAVDPWQRVHARLGATPAGVIDRWLTVEATPDDWATWTGLVFPVSGRYVVPGALVPIDIDLDRNLGTYFEPHLWMHYRLEALLHSEAAAA